ncbi:ABC transporter ATP-binding protein [Hyphomonas sp. CACIAM 19H1]|uniref:ABC transporter ATP-binding protein n=1 Tax=Hyphomonas sp. CACIAM 19H1 TaxID=1873716 RepID=UPI0013B04E0B|nr:ABC transporter ATP-binding protein [Hyphomonas sp. CACIAM 19H1]
MERRSAASLLLALGCVLAGAGLSAFAPVVLAGLVDELVAGGASVFLLVGLYAACLGLARAAGEGRTFFHARAEQDILRVLTLNVSRHILSLPMRLFDRHPSGALVQTLENGLQGYRLLLQHGVFTLLPGFLEIGIMAAILSYALDAAFLAVFGVCALLYGAVFAGGARKVLAASREVSSARIEVTTRFADSLRNIETVKAFSGEAEIEQRLDETLLETRRRWRRFHGIRLRNGLLVTAIFAAGLLTVLTLAAGQIAAGEMTPGAFVLVSAYMLQIVRPIELLGYAARDLGQGAAFIERLTGILQAGPEAVDLRGEEIPASGGMGISLAQVSYAPDGKAPILSDVSLEIGPGAKIGLVGASGSGKSTLLRLLLGFCVPNSGEVRIDEVPQIARRDEIAFIPQTPGLFNDTLANNVGFPDRFASLESVDSVLRRVGLSALSERKTGEGGALVSGGERQRVAIARALMRRPRLVLADEPTSALDPETESRILAELMTGFGEATLILASHRLRTVRHMDMIIVMSQGRVVESGTHDALLAAGGAYAAMWQIQEGGQV